MKTTKQTFTRLEADDGMILTDGENYGKVFCLPKNRKASEFSEITEEEYQKKLEELKAKEKEEVEENV